MCVHRGILHILLLNAGFQAVHEYITREYLRSCLISSLSAPTTSSRPGWGSHGTPLAGVNFRSTILSTIKPIDELAHQVIPHHPILKPHTRMLHHFRFLAPLLQGNILALWDSAVQMARLGEREMTEDEFVLGWEAAQEIRRTCVFTTRCMLSSIEYLSGWTIHWKKCNS